MREDKKKKDKEEEEHQNGPSEQNLILRRKKVKEGQMKITMRWKKVRWWIWYQMINEDLTQIRLTLTVVFERESPGTPSSSDILTSWLVFVFVLFLLHELHLEHILLSQSKSWSTPQMNRKWFNLWRNNATDAEEVILSNQFTLKQIYFATVAKSHSCSSFFGLTQYFSSCPDQRMS